MTVGIRGATGPGAALVRVWDRRGRPAGGAVLAAPGHLVTVAHVVNLALGRGKESAELPDGPVEVDFPLLAPGRRIAAEVVHWVPPAADGPPGEPEDLALLRLREDAPPGAVPAALSERAARFDDRIMTFGFPKRLDDGVWILGRLRGPQAAGWVQVDVDRAGAFDFQEGVSGAPVWDAGGEGALGVMVAAWQGPRGGLSGYLIPTAVLHAALPGLRAMARPPSPFPGLRPFDEEDAHLFFGRTDLVRRITALVDRMPVTTVIGSSGAGKSSLVRAGVLPALRARQDTLVVLLRPSGGLTPLRALAAALDRAVAPDREPAARVAGSGRIEQALRDGHEREVVRAVLERCGAGRLVVVVDQWEEAWAGAPEEARDFNALLGRALDPHPPFTVLAVLRADFLGTALQAAESAPLVQEERLVTVAELSRRELHEALTGPLRNTLSVTFEAGLVDRLLTDAGPTSGALPLLQFVAAELWAQQDHGRLTHAAYDALGGVRGALARHAENVWSGLDAEHRAHADRLLAQLASPLSEGSGYVRRLALLDDEDTGRLAVASLLAGARLLILRETDRTSPEGYPVVGAELAHDTLATHWARLNDVLAASREFRLWQEGLRQRIAQWEASGERGRRLLTGGVDLRDARRWARSHSLELSVDEHEFIARSRRRWWTRWRVAAVLALLTAWAVPLAVSVHNDAVRDAADDAATLAMHARDYAGNNNYWAATEALRAYRTSPISTARDAVDKVWTWARDVDRLLPDGATGSYRADASSNAYNLRNSSTADGRTLISTDRERVTVWQLREGRPTPRVLPSREVGYLELTAVSAGGRYAAYTVLSFSPEKSGGRTTACNAGTTGTQMTVCVIVHDLTDGRVRTFPIGRFGWMTRVVALSVDPSERVLGVVQEDATLLRWDLDTGAALPSVGRVSPASDRSMPLYTVAGLWLAPGGSAAVVLGRDGSDDRPTADGRDSASLHHVDLTRAPARWTVLARGLAPAGASVSADGTRAAAGVPASGGAGAPSGLAGEFRVWDVASGSLIARSGGQPAAAVAGALALDPHGTRLTITAESSTSDPGRQVFEWQVGREKFDDPAVPPTRLADPWMLARRIGEGPDAPIALFARGAVGLILPKDGRTPWERLQAEERSPRAMLDSRYQTARLCAALLNDGDPPGGWQGTGAGRACPAGH
ncbi:trypsin-like peptidase domain-containing protein [Kitasatospora sp. NPDC051984]|uniref:nSTAND1 domain-containing NTPase n=1 Tax=Kitasatospora sp. NPDC051984 TaxID=3364059 RepID=UPI0037C7A218